MKDVQRFLSATHVYSCHIDQYMEPRVLLTILLEENVPWSSSFVSEAVVNNLKKKISERPILAIFGLAKLSLVYTDASKAGLDTMLQQTDSCGMKRPIVYYSRKLISYEKNYWVTEIECLAIVETVGKWHCYLHGH